LGVLSAQNFFEKPSFAISAKCILQKMINGFSLARRLSFEIPSFGKGLKVCLPIFAAN